MKKSMSVNIPNKNRYEINKNKSVAIVVMRRASEI